MGDYDEIDEVAVMINCVRVWVLRPDFGWFTMDTVRAITRQLHESIRW